MSLIDRLVTVERYDTIRIPVMIPFEFNKTKPVSGDADIDTSIAICNIPPITRVKNEGRKAGGGARG